MRSRGRGRPRQKGACTMRIAQVSPLYEAVPPRTYGGTERVVSYLTEALVRQGHEVTLFASGDSVTRARLVASCPQGLRFDDRCTDEFAHHIILLKQFFQQAADFDLIHFHIDYVHFPLSRRQSTPHVTTLHGRLDLPDLVAVYQEFPEPPWCRSPMPSGSRSPGLTGRARCITGCHTTSTPSGRSQG